jgi:hypothetical protein
MIRITNGKNFLIVPTASYENNYKQAGWNIVAKKKSTVDKSSDKSANNKNKIE